MRTLAILQPQATTRLDVYHTEAFLTIQGLLLSDPRSRREIAVAAGVCTSTINKWAIGQVAFVRDSTMARVARIYGYRLLLVQELRHRAH